MDPPGVEALYDEWILLEIYPIHYLVNLVKLFVCYVISIEHFSPLLVQHGPDARPHQPGVGAVLGREGLLEPDLAGFRELNQFPPSTFGREYSRFEISIVSPLRHYGGGGGWDWVWAGGL